MISSLEFKSKSSLRELERIALPTEVNTMKGRVPCIRAPITLSKILYRKFIISIVEKVQNFSLTFDTLLKIVGQQYRHISEQTM